MSEFINPYSKEVMYINSPGGKGKMSERRKKINSRAKGQSGEREFIDFCCKLAGKEKSGADRRNNQRVLGGGSSVPDVEISWLPSLFHEVKNCDEFEIPSWIEKLLQDCPIGKVPVLAIKIPPHVRMCQQVKWWVFFPVEHLNRFCDQWRDALPDGPVADIDPFPVPFEAETFHFAGYLRKKHVPGQYVERNGWIGLDMHDLPALVEFWGS